MNGMKIPLALAKCSVPMDTANKHYAEILKQVADGDITIAEAD